MRAPAKLPVIHLVFLERVVKSPEHLVPVCGDWTGGTDWSTNPAAVSCPACLEGCRPQAAERASRAPPPAS